MPFPLHCLNFDLNYRLRKLMSPSEVVMMQKVARKMPGFGRLQRVGRIKEVHVSMRDGGTELIASKGYSGPDIPLNTDTCYKATHVFKARHFAPSDDPQVIFDYFQLAATQVEFVSCCISASFLQKIMERMTEFVNRVTFNCCTFDENDKFEHLMSRAFKGVKYIIFYRNCPFGQSWLKEFSDHTGLLMLMMKDLPASALMIDSADLINFVMAQHPNFRLTMEVCHWDEDGSVHDVEKMVKKVFNKKQFKQARAPVAWGNGVVDVQWVKNRRPQRGYFLPKGPLSFYRQELL